MNIKRIESEGSYTGSGETFDPAGHSVGRADLTVHTHRRILDAGTHQEPDAELFWMRSDRRWRQWMARCCWRFRRRMPGAANCGTPIESTSGVMVIPCSFGKRTRAR